MYILEHYLITKGGLLLELERRTNDVNIYGSATGEVSMIW